ncbi:chemotaxis protein CheA [Vreelandella populi]|uniref:Chemotaxis protein CheA n=1 Tax=Vreelandella populi TaxID=2498858 RepID=A0A3S0ZFU0_9GAMM|nr:chemotaxis protein CheA [Halomonas populi]RUR35726.1 chemotaxis protein CheA [Halomonas populi]RUR47917.1 chemotaxis protein CheA [Halomonas populi]
MNALLQQFLQESREALESIGSTLLAMEREPGDHSRLGELFRLVHTLKGNSGLFDFPALTAVLHAAEDVMDAVRNDALGFSQPLADQLLDAADYVSAFLDAVESQGTPGADFQVPPRKLVEGLRSWLATPALEGANSGVALVSTQNSRLPVDLPSAVRDLLIDAINAERTAFLLDYQPAADCFFQGTDPLHQVRQLPDVLWRRIRPLEAWLPAAEIDAYACNLRFEILLLASEESLAEHFRYVADQATWWPITLASLQSVDESVDTASGSDLAGFEPLALDILSTQYQALSACSQEPWPSGQHVAIVTTLERVLASQDDVTAMAAFQDCREQSNRQNDAKPLLSWLSGAMEKAIADDTPSTGPVTTPVQGELGGRPIACQALALGVAPDQADTITPRRADETASQAPAKVLKVEQEKIDRLMNLIGEIVVAKNGLPYLAERAEEQYGQRELAREIKAQYAVVNRIAEDLQDAIMQVRMMPVSFILQRFPRLVRDITRKLDKKVNLILEGEDTEADKAMIEALADPLVHIVRNSLDHGLEAPAERLAAGKPETGTLRIRASQNADHVVISIEDDGRGIDPQKIKVKVAAKGLVEPAALEAMSDQELVNLVFLPGFSTAEQVSDLSGRGVGMDVVRSGIEKVGGHLRLASQVGQGTQLSLSLPLSMAVTQVMVIESGGQRFGIPMDQVMETVRLPDNAIHTIKHQPTAQLRGRTIPLKGLNQLLAVPLEQVRNEDDEYALMVLRSRSELVGLLIDDFYGSIDIILKPMVGILGELSGYSGTAVMGDGSILMILNPTELFA